MKILVFWLFDFPHFFGSFWTFLWPFGLLLELGCPFKFRHGGTSGWDGKDLMGGGDSQNLTFDPQLQFRPWGGQLDLSMAKSNRNKLTKNFFEFFLWWTDRPGNRPINLVVKVICHHLKSKKATINVVPVCIRFKWDSQTKCIRQHRILFHQTKYSRQHTTCWILAV